MDIVQLIARTTLEPDLMLRRLAKLLERAWCYAAVTLEPGPVRPVRRSREAGEEQSA
jgi:hypothetical protein